MRTNNCNDSIVKSKLRDCMKQTYVTYLNGKDDKDIHELNNNDLSISVILTRKSIAPKSTVSVSL